MSLSFGWHEGETRSCAWPDDPAYGDIPSDVLDRWSLDGDASHFAGYAKSGQTPSVITLRTLTHREMMRAKALVAQCGDGKTTEAIFDVMSYMFRVAVSIDGIPDKIVDKHGAEHATHVVEQGVRVLAEHFVAALERTYPGIVEFFGGLVMRANMLSAQEKKASSPLSTETPSSGPAAAADAMVSQGSGATDAP